jgi:branched-chain amino acid transport system substrate-binding protein
MRLSRRRLLAGTAAAPLLGRTRAQAAGETIRIGVLTDLSGQYRDNSGPTSVIAAQQAVEDFRPEQHGFKVEILSADHQQKPDVGIATARQWFDRDGVDAVADLNNTAIALAVNGIVTQKDKVQLTTGAASSDLTGKYCNPNAVHWAPDTYAVAHSTGGNVVRNGGTSWFLVVPDYTFGRTLEREATSVIQAGGGKILGSVVYPFPGTTDFSSFLIQAQGIGANVIGFCNTGGDMENCVKQAHEFGLAKSGIRIVALFGFITEVHSMGLDTGQGLLLSETFYWDLNDRTRAFTERFVPKTTGNYPSSLHASCYSGVTHYLRAVAQLGPARAKASGREAIAAMKQLPTNDDCFGACSVRADGRFICPIYLFQVKTPEESRMPWDLYKLVATTPGEAAFRSLSQGGCPMIRS